MKKSIPFIGCLIATCGSMVAQIPQFKYYPVNETGYAALFPTNPGKAEVSLSDNELKLYSSEVEFNRERYGLIMVLLEDHFVKSDKETLESLLISYMEFLKLSNDISSSIGYEKQQTLPTNPLATGILDFWEDEQGAQWAVKGWVTNDALAVLYVHSTKEESMAIPNNFLNGFMFRNTTVKEDLKKVIPRRGKQK